MKKIFKGLLCSIMIMGLSACGSSQAPTQTQTSVAATSTPSASSTPVESISATTSTIVGVTAITEVFAGGQKVSAVAVEYDTAIDSSKLTTDDFTVANNTISKVYTNATAEKSDTSSSGNYVIVELSIDDSASYYLNSQNGPSVGGQKSATTTTASPPTTDAPTASTTTSPTASTGGGPANMPIDNTPSNNLTASVTQVKDITAVNNQVIAANTQAVASSKTINLVVDDFQQLVYTDTNYNNEQLMYNLYVPKNYDPSKTYPLVLFMADSSAVSTDPFRGLTQGIGGIIWAKPEEQAKHEAFVLVPQFTTVIANDDSQTTEPMDITIDLLKELQTQYSIDANKIYNTGQSMGGMTSIAMDIKYPDIFAASFLVACQWDATLVAPMVNDNLFIVVSNGDTKAFPGMNEITEALVKNGATLSSATWNSEATPEEFSTYVTDMLAKGANVNYANFEGGNHMYTWKVAYKIEGIRDWLFSQSK